MIRENPGSQGPLRTASGIDPAAWRQVSEEVLPTQPKAQSTLPCLRLQQEGLDRRRVGLVRE
jgi:hypothetical protein